ncbi:serine hydrolase, partial [uncultured Cyclobacterium sp.]|uniref:serine hydrolase n=1 Tax=uncultured Cyclobacterium sp. TaxID=453820 RepID=UPI0030EC0533
MKIHLLIPLVLLLSCNYGNEEKKLTQLEEEIKMLINETEGDFALAFRSLDGDENELFLNEKESFHAASTMKTPVMIALLEQEAAGKFSLQDSVMIRNSFKSILDGSLYKMDLGVDSQEALYQRIGEKASLYELMYEMIVRSSNLATNILIEKVGAANVTQLMRELGAEDIQILRGVEDLKAYDAGLSNTTTALDMMLVMEAIARRKVVGSQNMMQILSDQHFNDLIPKYLPKEVKIAHKT